MAIYQGNKELTLNNVSTVKHGGVTVYARKYKLKYFSYDFDNEPYKGYNVLPNIDLSKAKNLKIIISNGFQKYAGTISDDDFYEGLANSVDGFELHRILLLRQYRLKTL